MAEKTNSTTRTISEVGAVFVADRIHVDHKTQGASNINNNETKIPNSVSSVEINMVRIIYNLVRQKTKFAQNAQNADTLQKFAGLQTKITQEIQMRNSKRKHKKRARRRIPTRSHMLSSPQTMVGRTIK